MLRVAYDLCGGFSGTSSTVPSLCMKYTAGAQYADISWATPQLVHLDLSKSSAFEVELKARSKQCQWYRFMRFMEKLERFLRLTTTTLNTMHMTSNGIETHQWIKTGQPSRSFAFQTPEAVDTEDA